MHEHDETNGHHNDEPKVDLQALLDVVARIAREPQMHKEDMTGLMPSGAPVEVETVYMDGRIIKITYHVDTYAFAELIENVIEAGAGDTGPDGQTDGPAVIAGCTDVSGHAACEVYLYPEGRGLYAKAREHAAAMADESGARDTVAGRIIAIAIPGKGETEAERVERESEFATV